MHQSVNVASHAKMIEMIKAEFIGESAEVLRAALSFNGRDELRDALGGTVLLAYVLARRCGISPRELDEDIISKAESGISSKHALETGYGDLSIVKKHFEGGNLKGFDKKKRV